MWERGEAEAIPSFVQAFLQAQSLSKPAAKPSCEARDGALPNVAKKPHLRIHTCHWHYYSPVRASSKGSSAKRTTARAMAACALDRRACLY